MVNRIDLAAKADTLDLVNRYAIPSYAQARLRGWHQRQMSGVFDLVFWFSFPDFRIIDPPVLVRFPEAHVLSLVRVLQPFNPACLVEQNHILARRGFLKRLCRRK